MGLWDSDAPETDAQRTASDNGVRLMRRTLEIIDGAIARPPLQISVEMVCELHRIAMDGLIEGAGIVRNEDVIITGSKHQPPPWSEVSSLLDDMCAHCNERSGDAVNSAAYVLWRLNWIHPFAPDGNGRTARAVALAVLHARLGVVPGAAAGRPTFLEHLSRKRLDYNDALEAADAAWKQDRLDLMLLEQLIEQAIEASTEPTGSISSG